MKPNKQFTCACGNWGYQVYKVPVIGGTERDACRQCAQEYDREQARQVAIENRCNARDEQQTMEDLRYWGLL